MSEEAQQAEPAPPPPSYRLARLYAVGVQCIASSLGFFLTAVVKLPVPLYFPLSHRWSTVPNPEELAMDFYGRSLVAIAAGIGAGALTLAIFAVRARLAGDPAVPAVHAAESDAAAPDPQSGSGLTLVAVYAATALLLTMGVFGYQLYGRPPSPEPLPPGLTALQTAEKPAALRPAKSPAPGARRPPPPAPSADDSAGDSADP